MSFWKYKQIVGGLFAAARLFCGLIMISALAGCIGTYCPPTGCVTTVTANADANGVFTPSLRASFELGNSKEPPSQPHTGLAIEVEGMEAKASGSQYVNGLQAVYLNNTYFRGPQTLTNSFLFHYADASWRWRRFSPDEPLGVEFSAGAGRASMALTVASSLQNASDRLINYGVHLGGGPIWRLSPASSLGGRVSAFHSQADGGINNMARLEFYYARAFGPNASVRAGYVRWGAWGSGRTIAGNTMSDVRITGSGPEVQLGLDF